MTQEDKDLIEQEAEYNYLGDKLPIKKSLYDRLKQGSPTQEDKNKMSHVGHAIDRQKRAKQKQHQRISKLGVPFQAGEAQEKPTSPFPDPEEMGKLRQEYGSAIKGKFKNPERVTPFNRKRT